MFFLMFFYIFIMLIILLFFFFFFNDTATTEIDTLSLHDALQIRGTLGAGGAWKGRSWQPATTDRKSTRLNSSHVAISYAVFCLKKKKKKLKSHYTQQKKNINIKPTNILKII